MALNTPFLRFQPVNPPLDGSSSHFGLGDTFQNTAVQNTLSFKLPAITREVEEFVLAGSYFVGPTTPYIPDDGSNYHCGNLAALATAHAIFPKKVGIHSLIQTVTLLTGNGVTLNLENNYPAWCFMNARSGLPNTSPSAPVGVWVTFDDLSPAKQIASSPQQIPRSFLMRIRFRGCSKLNLIAMGGLQLDMTFSSPQAVCTFPQLCFPYSQDTSSDYLNPGYIRPWMFPAVYGTTLNTTNVTGNGISFTTASQYNSLNLRYPIQFSSTLTPLQFVQSLTFYVKVNLLAVVNDILISSPEQSTTYECKAYVTSYLPVSTGVFSALPTPVAGYCIGDSRLDFVVMGEAAGLGWTNYFQTHAYVGYEEWRFNSSLPGLTYSVQGNILTEYAPTMPTNYLDILKSDGIMSGLPLQIRLMEGVGQYYLGKTFLGATSLTCLVTAVQTQIAFPASIMSSSPTLFTSSEVPSLRLSVARASAAVSAQNTVIPFVCAWSVGGTPANSGSLENSLKDIFSNTDAKALAPFGSAQLQAFTDLSRDWYNPSYYSSAVLASSTRRMPPIRAGFDTRTVYQLNPHNVTPGTSGYMMKPIQCRAFSLNGILSTYAGQTNKTIGSMVGTMNPKPDISWLVSQTTNTTLPNGNATVGYVDFKPMVRSIPVRTVTPAAPKRAQCNWRYTFDTFETRTLTDLNLSIAPSATQQTPIVNPTTFTSHPASKATKSPLYLRETPVYSVPPLYDGNFAMRWNAITMGTVHATKIQVPLGCYTNSSDAVQSLSTIPEAVMTPIHAYAPALMTAANRFTNRPVGDAGCVAVSTYITPQGIMRNISERKYLSMQLQNMSQSERLAYENAYRGHGAITSKGTNVNKYARDNRIYKNTRPDFRFSHVQYLGYKGVSMNNLQSASPTFPVTPTSTTAFQSLQPSLSSTSPSLTHYPGDRIAALSGYPQYMVLSAEQLPTLRAPLSYPQTPDKQLQLEFDQQLGNFINVCAGGGVFTSNTADPHIEMALAARSGRYGEQYIPHEKLQPRLGFLNPDKCVIRQLVYNPSDMPEMTALAFANGIKVKVPASVSYDTYQTLSRARPNLTGYDMLYQGIDVLDNTNFSQFATYLTTVPFKLNGLTIYSQDPMPLGGLNIDHIRISVRPGHYDFVQRSPTVLPLVQPKLGLFQSGDDMSMSLFNYNNMNLGWKEKAFVSPPSNGVYFRPTVDGMDLRTIEPFFGTPIAQIEQYSLISGGKMNNIPHDALYETTYNYLDGRFTIPSYTLKYTADGPISSNKIGMPYLKGFIKGLAYAVDVLYTAQPALTGNASLQTAHSWYEKYPGCSNPLLLYTYMSLGNARLLNYNFQFLNQPINSVPESTLNRCLSTYYAGMNDFTALQDKTMLNPVLCYLAMVNMFATPTEYTQTIDLFSMDEWVMTMTGIVCVNKAFAR